MKVKLYKTVSIDEIKKYTGANLEPALDEIERYLTADGFSVERDNAKNTISCMIAKP